MSNNAIKLLLRKCNAVNCHNLSITQQVHIHMDHYRLLCEKTQDKYDLSITNIYYILDWSFKVEQLIFFYFNHSSIGVYLATVNMYGWSILFFFFVFNMSTCLQSCLHWTNSTWYDSVLWWVNVSRSRTQHDAPSGDQTQDLSMQSVRRLTTRLPLSPGHKCRKT